VGDKSSGLDPQYVEQKRRQLTKLRDELRKTANTAEADEGNLKTNSNLQAREYEDDAQRLDALEREGNLVSRDVDRLVRVERALEKIAEGSYGLSDVSRQPIPRERLDAIPEATMTLSEQAASEQAASER
jgi:DnaK suppressor protein